MSLSNAVFHHRGYVEESQNYTNQPKEDTLYLKLDVRQRELSFRMESMDEYGTVATKIDFETQNYNLAIGFGLQGGINDEVELVSFDSFCTVSN